MQQKKNLIDTALGLTPPDLCLQGGTVVNVYSGEKYVADIGIKGGRIAYVGQDPGNFAAGTCPIIDVSGLTLLPGYIEPHGHPMQIHSTVEYTRVASQNGMTAIVADSYKMIRALGVKGFIAYTEKIKQCTPVKVYWFIRIFSITYSSTEAPLYSRAELEELIRLPQVLCIGETSRWPAILQKETFALQAIDMFRAAGKRPDGHTSGAAGKKLTALAAAGISGCHESLTAEDVWERLRSGMHVMLRSSSQRKDIDNFLGIVQDKNVDRSRFMLTADGTSPAFIEQNYHIAGIADELISKGIDPLTAVRMITLNPASYFRIDHEIGSLTPGRAADIIVTEGFNLSKPRLVLIDGRIVHGSSKDAGVGKSRKAGSEAIWINAAKQESEGNALSSSNSRNDAVYNDNTQNSGNCSDETFGSGAPHNSSDVVYGRSTQNSGNCNNAAFGSGVPCNSSNMVYGNKPLSSGAAGNDHSSKNSGMDTGAKRALFKDSPLVGMRKTYFAFDWRVTPEDFAVRVPSGENRRIEPVDTDLPVRPGPEIAEEKKGARPGNFHLPAPPTGDQAGEGIQVVHPLDPLQGIRPPDSFNFLEPKGTASFPVIEMVNAIITRRLDLPLPVTGGIVTPGCMQPGLLKIALLDMQQHRISTGFIKGLANDLEGFASSHCVALGVIIVFGSDDTAMARAANRVLELGGGMAMIDNNRIVWEIDLELPGELTNRPYEEVLHLAKELEALAQQRGYALGDFFHTIHFLPCDFLPFIRISTEGIFDVLNRKIIYP